MKTKPILLYTLCAAAAFVLALTPRSSNGQAGADDPQLTALVLDFAKQQAQIAENQARIDEKVALIAEDLRIARIYVGRGGGKVTAP